MSTAQQPANLAEMVRDRAKSRGNALAYEFEGRHTSFAEFDIKTNRVANALIHRWNLPILLGLPLYRTAMSGFSQSTN